MRRLSMCIALRRECQRRKNMEDKAYELGAMIGFTRDSYESDGLPAMVSIEMQKYGQTYEVEDGFPCGTIFPALNKPFCPGGMTK